MTRLHRAVGLMLAAVSAPLFAAELTLQQAVSEALAHNPQARIAGAQQREAAAAQREARSAWLPRVDVSETAIRSNNPVFVFGSLLEQGRFGAANFDPQFLNSPPALRNYRLALNIRYTLFDQLRRLDATREAANGVDRSSALSNETQQAIRVEVMSKFYGVLLAVARRDVAAAAVKAAESDAASMRAKFEHGLLVKSDALAAEVQLASLREQEIEADGGVTLARAALNATIGRDLLSATPVRGGLPETAAAPGPLDALLERASTRGRIAAATLDHANARLEFQSARGSLLPRVETFATWGASGAAIGSRNGDRTIGAALTLDVFDGGARRARIAQAAANVDRAKAAEDAARSNAGLEIIAAHERVRTAVERVAVATAAVHRADAAARIVRDRYEQGLTPITEHLRAQTALVTAQLNLLTARYDAAIGAADLARATGDLNGIPND